MFFVLLRCESTGFSGLAKHQSTTNQLCFLGAANTSSTLLALNGWFRCIFALFTQSSTLYSTSWQTEGACSRLGNPPDGRFWMAGEEVSLIFSVFQSPQQHCTAGWSTRTDCSTDVKTAEEQTPALIEGPTLDQHLPLARSPNQDPHGSQLESRQLLVREDQLIVQRGFKANKNTVRGTLEGTWQVREETNTQDLADFLRVHFKLSRDAMNGTELNQRDTRGVERSEME
ncbi:hypothetical protein BDN72DRAFT_859853 [Pluteus cervinus]|uniref:Uncharacterized protein n=1 Tax=Pluteus cervinus TaxID=181527 RepID=A0ACD3ALZ3_9AGAR|nr:hypothetical protein BDN72DRAFT_859853 [Pluteus cervinus]